MYVHVYVYASTDAPGSLCVSGREMPCVSRRLCSSMCIFREVWLWSFGMGVWDCLCVQGCIHIVCGSAPYRSCSLPSGLMRKCGEWYQGPLVPPAHCLPPPESRPRF